MVTEMVGVTVNAPMPVVAAELKNLTAVGAVTPAGTPIGRVTAFVGLVHVDPPLQAETRGVIEEAPVASVWVPELNWVEVTVRFQPPPVPRASTTVSGSW